MLLATTVKGMLDARNALQTPQGISLPSYISEQIQKLALYTGATEEILADYESDLIKKEATQFKSYMADGKSANMSTDLLKHDFSDEKAEVARLTRLVNSSWKIISASQSRVKHLIAEATNQI